MLQCFQVEGSNGGVNQEVLSVTSQTELDRKKAGMSLPLQSGQAKYLPETIQTPQDGPEDESGSNLVATPGQQIRSKIDSFQNANFLISQPNPMMLPLIGIVSERRFQ